MRYVLDTTAFSAAMRREAGLLTLLKDYRPGDIVTVPPVVAEIQFGIKRLDNSSKMPPAKVREGSPAFCN